jgi:hypothetical protein
MPGTLLGPPRPDVRESVSDSCFVCAVSEQNSIRTRHTININVLNLFNPIIKGFITLLL